MAEIAKDGWVDLFAGVNILANTGKTVLMIRLSHHLYNIRFSHEDFFAWIAHRLLSTNIASLLSHYEHATGPNQSAPHLLCHFMVLRFNACIAPDKIHELCADINLGKRIVRCELMVPDKVLPPLPRCKFLPNVSLAADDIVKAKEDLSKIRTRVDNLFTCKRPSIIRHINELGRPKDSEKKITTPLWFDRRPFNNFIDRRKKLQNIKFDPPKKTIARFASSKGRNEDHAENDDCGNKGSIACRPINTSLHNIFGKQCMIRPEKNIDNGPKKPEQIDISDFMDSKVTISHPLLGSFEVPAEKLGVNLLREFKAEYIEDNGKRLYREKMACFLRDKKDDEVVRGILVNLVYNHREEFRKALVQVKMLEIIDIEENDETVEKQSCELPKSPKNPTDKLSESIKFMDELETCKLGTSTVYEGEDPI